MQCSDVIPLLISKDPDDVRLGIEIVYQSDIDIIKLKNILTSKYGYLWTHVGTGGTFAYPYIIRYFTDENGFEYFRI
jgi:hypothetical protein